MDEALVYKFISNTQIYRSCTSQSIVKQNVTRICSAYTTALNPISCIPFSSRLFFFVTGEKLHLPLDKQTVSSFSLLIYWLVFDSENDTVNT